MSPAENKIGYTTPAKQVDNILTVVQHSNYITADSNYTGVQISLYGCVIPQSFHHNMVVFDLLNLPSRSTVTAVGRVKLVRTNVGCDPSNRIRRSSPRPVARFVSVQKMNLKRIKIRRMQPARLFHLTCWVNVFCAVVSAFSNFVEKAKTCTCLVLVTELCNISVTLGYYFQPQSDGILTIE